jgi:hypothetical protein
MRVLAGRRVGTKPSFSTQDRVNALASLEPAGNPGASSVRNHAEPRIVTTSWLYSAAAGNETIETKRLRFVSQFYITIDFPLSARLPAHERRHWPMAEAKIFRKAWEQLEYESNTRIGDDF